MRSSPLALVRVERVEVLLDGFTTGVEGLFARYLVSGFFARKIPAPPPTSAPTSWPSALEAQTDRPKQNAAEIKTARSVALAFITFSPAHLNAFGLLLIEI
jgi:hypothetical protein